MNKEYQKIYKNYLITLLIIILLIVLGFVITYFVNTKTNKMALIEKAKQEKQNSYIQEVENKEKNYNELKEDLDYLCDSLQEYNKDTENDNSEKLRYYNNLATVYDRQLSNIAKNISNKIPQNKISSFDADLNNFYKQRIDKCKKLTFGIENNIIKGIEYYKNYADITKTECYDIIEEYSEYLGKE